MNGQDEAGLRLARKLGGCENRDDLVAFLVSEFRISAWQAGVLDGDDVQYLLKTLDAWRNGPGKQRSRTATGVRETYRLTLARPVKNSEDLARRQSFLDALSKGGSWVSEAQRRHVAKAVGARLAGSDREHRADRKQAPTAEAPAIETVSPPKPTPAESDKLPDGRIIPLRLGATFEDEALVWFDGGWEVGEFTSEKQYRVLRAVLDAHLSGEVGLSKEELVRATGVVTAHQVFNDLKNRKAFGRVLPPPTGMGRGDKPYRLVSPPADADATGGGGGPRGGRTPHVP